MKTRRDYRTDLKSMSKVQLKKWIDRQEDRLLVDDGDASTPLLTKVIYAKELLKTKKPETMKTTNYDVYIKDEGFAKFFFDSKKAKKFAKEQGIEKNRASNYTIGLKLSNLKKTLKELTKNGLTYESEIDLRFI